LTKAYVISVFKNNSFVDFVSFLWDFLFFCSQCRIEAGDAAASLAKSLLEKMIRFGQI